MRRSAAIILTICLMVLAMSVSAQGMTCTTDPNNPQPLVTTGINSVMVRPGQTVIVDIRAVDNDTFCPKMDFNDLNSPSWVTWFGPTVPDPNTYYPSDWRDCYGQPKDPNAITGTRPLKISVPATQAAGTYPAKMSFWDGYPAATKTWWYLTAVVVPDYSPAPAGFTVRPSSN